jgi:hypothetical protein
MDGIPVLNRRRIAGAAALLLLAGAACGGGVGGTRFDGERAFRDLVRQCEFGPRVPGTEAHREMEAWLLARLRATAEEVLVDTFTVEVEGDTLPEFRNYTARFDPGNGTRVLLCAHYDSRPRADRDPDPEKRGRAIAGANDGASGVAVLLELARVFAADPPGIGVDMVFFDGEDYGESSGMMLLGSRRFASRNGDYRPLYGLLLDMVGDRDLRIYQELYSVRACPEIVDRVWSRARAEGRAGVFIPVPRHAVYDDHVPLLEVGIRCIDIIDFDYPWWHTTADTPDKCSAASLQAVGDVVLALLTGEAP